MEVPQRLPARRLQRDLFKRTAQTLSSRSAAYTEKNIHRHSNNRCAVHANTLRRVLSGARGCGFGSVAADQGPLRFRSGEVDFCHGGLVRAGAITELKGKPYVHFRAANCPAATPSAVARNALNWGWRKHSQSQAGQ